MTAADVLVEALIDWGVELIFGLPGDGINGVMESLRTHRDRVRFFQVRHEEAAAFMACGYAKFTGKLGVCLATSGPGGIHLLNGLYDAKLDGQPVLAITGLQFHDLIGTYTQQDVALDKLFMDVAVFNERIMGPTHVENIADLACRMALAYRGVSHITFPVDLQEKEVKERQRSERNIPHHTSDVYSGSARLPDRTDLERASQILNRGRRVAILAGRGALHATDELERVAELLAAPIVKALLGKAAVPDDALTPRAASACLAQSRHRKPWKIAIRYFWSVRHSLWAAHHRRRELFVGWPTVEAILGNKLAPGLLDRYLAKTGFASQQTSEPEDPDRDNNLWKPVLGDHGVHGRFDTRAHEKSFELWTALHRRAIGWGWRSRSEQAC